MPSTLRNHLPNLSIGARKYLKNTSWLLAEKIFRISIGLFTSIWVARYLGPQDFGVLNYAQSFVLLVSVISSLGLDGIIVRELVKDQGKRDSILGSAFFLKIAGALFSVGLIIISFWFDWNDSSTNQVIFILSLCSIFQSLNVIDFYFQSKVMSKYVVFGNTISLITSAVLRILFIIFDASLIYFAFVILFESIVISCALVFFYSKHNLSMKAWTANINLMANLLKDSWPLVLSSIVVTLYMKIDILMIKEMIGQYDVGLYSASTRLSELWYFVPVLVSSSLFPAILNAREKSAELYEKRIEFLYKALISLAVIFSFFISFTGNYIVEFLFGTEYFAAAEILKVQVWTSIFICILMVSNKWLIAENKTMFIFLRGAAGAILNIILNLYFIPIYGVVAAAYTSLVTVFTTSMIIDLSTKDTRKHLIIKCKGFVPLHRIQDIRSYLIK